MAPLQPPDPPHYKPLSTQDVNCCGDKVRSFPLLTAAWDSMVSVEAKAQQDPHYP